MPAKNVIPFTKHNLDNLPIPTADRIDYHDEKCPGLICRMTKAGVKTFCAFPWNGVKRKNERFTFGTYPQLNVDDARRAAKDLFGKLARGIDVKEELRREKQKLAFGKLFEDYIERHAKVNKRTVGEDQSNYRRYLEGPLGSRGADDITRADIAAIHSAITRKGTPVAANRVLALVSSVYGWALRVGLAENNPAKGVKKNREVSRTRFIQPGDEFTRFFRAVEVEANVVLRDYFLLCLYVGLRRMDVAKMRWSQINLINATWTLPRTKNGDPQVVPLDEAALAVLEERWKHKESDFVFPGSGKSGHLVEPKSGLRRVLGRMDCYTMLDRLAAAGVLCEATKAKWLEGVAGKPAQAIKALRGLCGKHDVEVPEQTNLRIHDLRRTFGSYQAITGASLPVIMKAMNHKSFQATQVYARLHLDGPRKAVGTAIAAMNQYREGSEMIRQD